MKPPTTAPARPAHAPALRIIRIRPVRLKEVAALEASTFPAGDAFRERSLRHQMRSPACDFLGFRAGDGIGGYGTVLYRQGSVKARLYNLVVAPPQRGNGQARRLMMALIAAARKRRCLEMTLEVREDNAIAIAFYRKLGFVEFAQAPGYYHDGAAALKMRMPLL